MQQELSKKEVHIWSSYIAHSTYDVDKRFTYLEPVEKERAQGFYFERDRTRFVQSRYLLRSLLAKYIGKAASEIRFVYNPYGKPALTEQQAKLYFNISHAGNWVVMSFAKDIEMGIDLAYQHPTEDISELISPDIFTDRELSYFDNVTPIKRQALFYKLWASKEAYLKAIGTGLSVAPNNVEVILGENGDLSVAKGQQKPTTNHYLIALKDIPDPYVGCLAVPKLPDNVRYFRA
jgi:4'-phosphopantetheinyl transferase